jgi:dynein assembly factor 3, axonemal
MAASNTFKSLGMHGQWGFSAAFDFAEALERELHTLPAEINILLLHPGDIRHVICTISRVLRLKQQIPTINFYLLENPVEIVARDLILLELFLDFKVPIRQRATIFLEVFGNMKVQKRTEVYLEELSSRILQLLSGNPLNSNLEHIVAFDMLGYRERDYLELSLKNYDRKIKMDMNSWFDHRKRGLYEERYDSRNGLFDWDYYECLKKRGSIIHIKQFKQWREKGIAFEFGDQEYTEANKTLMTYTEGLIKRGKDHGLKKEVMGYWGDIVCSPYYAFGIDSETPNKFADGLFEIYNKNTGTEQHRHHAVEVALYNLFSYMWELESNNTYIMKREHDVYSGLGQEEVVDNEKLLDADDSQEKAAAIETTKNALETVPEENEETEEQNQTEDLGQVDKSENELEQPELLKNITKQTQQQSSFEQIASKDIEAAESIDDHLSNIRIFPMTGTFQQHFQNRQKFHKKFHSIFISSRYAQLLNEPSLADLLTSPDSCGFVAVESGKFVIPISGRVKLDYEKHCDDYATALGLERMTGKNMFVYKNTYIFCPLLSPFLLVAPVFRRRRDEVDTEDDVLFYRPIREK